MNASAAALAWVDGELVSEQHAGHAAWSPTFHYGYGVFEGVRVYPTAAGPAAFRLPEHLLRLRASATAYPVLDAVRWSDDELTCAVAEVVRANDFESCYLRPVICLATGSVGNDPTTGTVRTLILASPWSGLLPARGLRLGLSRWRRPGPLVRPAGVKANGDYQALMLAKGEAVRAGWDDALMLDEAGHVVEATSANLFLRLGRTLVSPGAEQGALPGITRDTVCELALALGLSPQTRAVSLAEVYQADEAFLTGTGAEIRPIASVNDRRIGDGTPGPVTGQLAVAYERAVRGLDPAPERRAWLTLC